MRGCGRVFPDTALFLAFVSVGRAAVSCGYGPVRDREGAAGLEWVAFSVSGLGVQDTKNKGAAGPGICEYPEGRQAVDIAAFALWPAGVDGLGAATGRWLRGLSPLGAGFVSAAPARHYGGVKWETGNRCGCGAGAVFQTVCDTKERQKHLAAVLLRPHHPRRNRLFPHLELHRDQPGQKAGG